VIDFDRSCLCEFSAVKAKVSSFSHMPSWACH